MFSRGTRKAGLLVLAILPGSGLPALATFPPASMTAPSEDMSPASPALPSALNCVQAWGAELRGRDMGICVDLAAEPAYVLIWAGPVKAEVRAHGDGACVYAVSAPWFQERTWDRRADPKALEALWATPEGAPGQEDFRGLLEQFNTSLVVNYLANADRPADERERAQQLVAFLEETWGTYGLPDPDTLRRHIGAYRAIGATPAPEAAPEPARPELRESKGPRLHEPALPAAGTAESKEAVSGAPFTFRFFGKIPPRMALASGSVQGDGFNHRTFGLASHLALQAPHKPGRPCPPTGVGLPASLAGSTCLVGTTGGCGTGKLVHMGFDESKAMGSPVLQAMPIPPGQSIRRMACVNPRLALVAFSNDPSLQLASLHLDGRPLGNKGKVRVFPGAGVADLAICQPFPELFAAASGPQVAVMDLATGRRPWIALGEAEVRSLDWRTDDAGLQPSATLADGQVHLFDLRQDGLWSQEFPAAGRPGLAAHTWAGPHLLVLGFEDGGLTLTDIRGTGAPLGTVHLAGQVDSVLRLERRGDLLLASGQGGFAALRLDPASPTQVGEIAFAHTLAREPGTDVPVAASTFACNGDIYSGSSDGWFFQTTLR